MQAVRGKGIGRGQMSFRKKNTRPVFRAHRAALLVAALTAAACAPSEGPRHAIAAGPVPAAPTGVTTAQAAVFPTHEAQQVFAYGFSAITDRYINPVTAADLATEGLRGLGGIDPGLVVAVEDGRAELYAGSALVAAQDAPPPQDVRGWAGVLATLVDKARYASPTLAEATPEDVYEAVFDSALGGLDMFSRYAGAEEARDHRASRNGFGGIGIRYVRGESGLEVRDVFEEAPCDGLLFPGDVITGVDGRQIAEFDTRTVKSLLRGPIDSNVTLTVQRAGIDQPVQVPIRRALVVPRTVSLEMDGDIGVIRISGFNQRTAESVETAVKRARAQLGSGLRGLVLDLRGNPGGLLDQAVSVSDLFIDDGSIVSTRGRHPESMQFYSARHGDIANGLPLVVLVDGRSASSAEIVSAALQDRGRAVVIGTTSYGKGTVQTVVRLPNDGEMTLTWSRFHSPSGYALHGLGVMPALCTTNAEPATEAQQAAVATEGETDAIEDGGIVNAGHVTDAGMLGQQVERLLSDRASADATVPVQYARWRSTPLDDAETRRALRTNCPPVNHAGNAVDLALGERLIREPGLYAWAIGLTHGTDTARR